MDFHSLGITATNSGALSIYRPLLFFYELRTVQTLRFNLDIYTISRQRYSTVLLVDIMHDVPGPGQLDLQLALMLHKEVHQGPGHGG